MKEIPLVNSSKVAIVDDSDFAFLSTKRWFLNKQGYAARVVERGYINFSVRLADCLIYCERPNVIDHIDRDKLNNQRSNLRVVTLQQNAMNKSKAKYTTLCYKGVWYHKYRKSFVARIGVGKKTIALGTHKTAISAAIAYNEGAFKYHGEFAVYNKLPTVFSM